MQGCRPLTAGFRPGIWCRFPGTALEPVNLRDLRVSVVNPDEQKLKKLRWRCHRRGIVEMDIAFGTLLDRHYTHLPPEQQQAFEALIDEADLDIMNWITGRREPPDRYRELVTLMRDSTAVTGEGR
ncbi:MAG: succinate dehydrogenase assembly factor 2 [Gammaproteobacteria bacterium]|nr:MAG: succinate dehydrogenase assembly factor 2 [Gammaproteobacteria bacterium]